MRDTTADIDTPHNSALLESVRRGDREAFRRLAEPYRQQIQLHCYHMLGSFEDAEDLAQETFLRAWRGLAGFEGRANFRNWLYRIATNACIDALARRANMRRVIPEAYSPPTEEMPIGTPALDIPWIEPYPDSALAGIPDAAPGPEVRYELHESVQLAFVAAIQLLPPRQRAVLLLRDVLGWSAAETAGLLDTSVASANSALQRARATLTKQFPSGQPTVLPAPDDEQRELLDRYVRVWEGADVDGLVALLRDDAIFTMPPWPHWYRGVESVRAFLRWVWQPQSDETSEARNSYRLIPTRANLHPAFVAYRRTPTESNWHAHAIQVLTLQNGAIEAIETFRDPKFVKAFGFPVVLSDESPALCVMSATPDE